MEQPDPELDCKSPSQEQKPEEAQGAGSWMDSMEREIVTQSEPATEWPAEQAKLEQQTEKQEQEVGSWMERVVEKEWQGPQETQQVG